MFHYLLSDHSDEVHYPQNALYIQNGNALIHGLKDLPSSFGAICLKVLDKVVSKKHGFVFSTDSYFKDSIKAQERRRRGMLQKLHIDGPATRRHPYMNTFLQNDENKRQLCDLLLKVWSSRDAASRLEGCLTAVLIVQGKTYELTGQDGKVEASEIHSLMSNQETDTHVILYLNYAVELGYKSAVVCTPDTDIFFLLLHYALDVKLKIYLQTGVGKQTHCGCHFCCSHTLM